MYPGPPEVRGHPGPAGPEVRAACELFGAAFSLQLTVIEEKEHAEALHTAVERTAEVAALLDGGPSESLAAHTDAVRELAGADGLVLWRLLTGLVLRHAETLTRLNEELRMTNADLDSFAHAAAHDLKEPLRGISNAAVLLREVPLAKVLDAALEVAGPRLAEERGTVLRGELPVVRADGDRLYEILVNLLVNAAKYAGDHDRRTVEVGTGTVVPPGGNAAETAVVVRDNGNGIGIPADQHEAVSALFHRLHGPAERGGGTGVGPAVVKRIVERHRGRLWLESTPGEGTAFWFTLGTGASSRPRP